LSNWVVIYASNSPNQLQITKAILEDSGIPVVTMDKTGSRHMPLTNADIQLYVKAEDAIQAKYIISKNSL